jgi:uncharacterized membrane protein YfcA
MEAEIIFIVCFFVFLSGLIDSIAGGGGLISLPAYLASGLPVHTALGCNKFSSTFGTLVSSIRFWKRNMIHLKSVFISIIFALIGSGAGAKTVLYVDDHVFKVLLLIIIPIVAVFMSRNKEFGTKNEADSIGKGKVNLLSAIIGLGIGFYDGFIGPGTGTFLIFIYSFLLRLDLVTASGNAKMVNFASNIGALITFLIHGHVYFALAIPCAFFGILGNIIGSGLALKNGSRVIRPVFLSVLGLLVLNLFYSLMG